MEANYRCDLCEEDISEVCDLVLHGWRIDETGMDRIDVALSRYVNEFTYSREQLNRVLETHQLFVPEFMLCTPWLLHLARKLYAVAGREANRNVIEKLEEDAGICIVPC